jgi:site-specific DNA recombinase
MGKSLMHDPKRAPLVRRAFEDYATRQYTKEQLLKRGRAWGLTNRRGKPLTSQAIGMLLRNQLYAGIVDVPEYGVRAKRGDFEPLISEELFYQVQAVLSGRVPSTAPRQRAHPDFPLRGFVRCHSCGRGIAGSWSKGRNEYYAYYHCRPGCRAVNVSKARLEGLFADQLALLQPTPGYMRLLKESVLQIWKARKATVRDEIATAERAAKAIQEKLDRLDEAFLFERSIDIETYDRHAEKLREELSLCGWTVTPASSKNSTRKASWRSQNAPCRAPQTCGCRRRSNSDSGSNNSSFPKESRSTENALFEPA